MRTTHDPRFIEIDEEIYNLNLLVKYYHDSQSSETVIVMVNQTVHIEDPSLKWYNFLKDQTL